MPSRQQTEQIYKVFSIPLLLCQCSLDSSTRASASCCPAKQRASEQEKRGEKQKQEATPKDFSVLHPSRQIQARQSLQQAKLPVLPRQHLFQAARLCHLKLLPGYEISTPVGLVPASPLCYALVNTSFSFDSLLKMHSNFLMESEKACSLQEM